MKDYTNGTPDKSGGEWMIKLAAFGFGMGMGALLGSLFIYQFVHAFAGQVPLLRLYCGLGVGLLMGLSLYHKAARQLRRKRRTGQIAEELGLDYSSDDEDQLKETLREIFSGSEFLSVSNVMRKPIGSAQVVIADLRRVHHSSSRSSSSSNSTTRTIAFFESPELSWPAFTLQPEGMALNMLSSLTGIQDIDFDGSPEFSKSYHLTGTRSDLVRQVFTPESLQYFTDHPGMEVRADGSRLVLVRPGSPCEPEQIGAFIQLATEVFTVLVKASVQTQSVRDAAAAKPPPPEAAPANMPGLVGAMIRRMMVTPQALHSFLCAAPPRQIPPKIRRRRYSAGSLVAVFVGFVFFAVGSCFAVYSAFYAEGPWNDNRVVPLIFGIVFPLVGFPIWFFALRYRYINWRLLKYGVLVDAIVVAVEKTSVAVNNQQQYRMRLRFDTRMGPQETYCNIYGQRARESGRLAKNNETTRVLYDPNKPRRVLWTESLLLDYNSF